MKKYETAIILGHELLRVNGKYRLSEQTQQRTDRGIELLSEGTIPNLIVSGGCENLYEKNSIAGLMKEYAIQKGVDENRIIKEEISRDTVGQLIFTKLGVVKPQRWKKIILITHPYHIERTKNEVEFIFLGDYSIEYRLVPNHEIICNDRDKEVRSYQSFIKTFKGVRPGDDTSILNTLLFKHDLYNNNPENFRKRLGELIDSNN